MHACPDCGSVCSCDIDDMWFEEPPSDCSHRCRHDDYDYSDMEDEGSFEDDRCQRCGQMLAINDDDLCEHCERLYRST